MSEKTVEKTLFGSKYKIEAGTVARQASGAVLMSCEDTVVLATVVAEENRIEEDFLPLTVNYQEKTYAAGKIPGGFFRREGRPSEQEILTSRLIDRSIRPLITKRFSYPGDDNGAFRRHEGRPRCAFRYCGVSRACPLGRSV